MTSEKDRLNSLAPKGSMVSEMILQLEDGVKITDMITVLSTEGSVRSVTGLGRLGFGMCRHPAWAVGSYNSGPPAGGTPQV